MEFRSSSHLQNIQNPTDTEGNYSYSAILPYTLTFSLVSSTHTSHTSVPPQALFSWLRCVSTRPRCHTLGTSMRLRCRPVKIFFRRSDSPSRYIHPLPVFKFVWAKACLDARALSHTLGSRRACVVIPSRFSKLSCKIRLIIQRVQVRPLLHSRPVCPSRLNSRRNLISLNPLKDSIYFRPRSRIDTKILSVRDLVPAERCPRRFTSLRIQPV